MENKHSLYCGDYCMKELCESSREQAKNVIDFEKKKNLTNELTKNELKLY